MKNKIILSLTLLSLVFSPTYAQNFVGDSVMNPNNNTSNNTITDPSGNIAYTSYTSENLNDVQFGTCPSGFTYNGGLSIPYK